MGVARAEFGDESTRSNSRTRGETVLLANFREQVIEAGLEAHRRGIVYGVADYRGDSYFLSTKAREVKASTIVFAGVRFMAETAKILSPHATVLIPDREAGCSLAAAVIR